VESRAAIIRNGDFANAGLVAEGTEDAAIRSPTVAISHRREDSLFRSAVAVRGEPELLGRKFLGSVAGRWMARLVAGDENGPLDPPIETGVDDVHGAKDVGLDGVCWIVGTQRDHLHGGGMDAEIRAGKRPVQAFLVSHVADEVREPTRKI